MKLLLTLLMWIMVIGSVQATALMSDDFNSYATGVLPTGAKWLTVGDNGTTQLARVTTDANNHFQQGTSNQYLTLSYTVPTATVATITDVSPKTLIGQVSFNFYDIQDASPSGSGYFLRIGNSNANGNTAFAIGMKEGSIYLATGAGISPAATPFVTYSMGTLNSISIVFNNASATSYDYGTGLSVAAGTMDVWLNNVLVGDNLSYAASGLALDTLLDNINFTAKGTTFNNSMEIDDVIFSNTATIPEPHSQSYFLLGAALCGFWQMLRRRQIV